jgi:chorismate-pyruvate lyase
VTATAAYAAPPIWPDTPFSRLEALALLQTLNVELLSHDSATLTLEQWCGAHHLADKPQVIAQRDTGVDKPVSDEQRQLLQVGPSDIVRYRRVQLACGGVVLSQADNWYVPARLTPEMNAQLDGSDTPFGKVVGGLHFQRHTLAAQLLWQPLPSGWETGVGVQASVHRAHAAGGGLAIPATVLEHRAVLTLPDGTPFSEVVETYTGNVLAFPMPLQVPSATPPSAGTGPKSP